MTWGSGTNGEKDDAGNEKETANENKDAPRTIHQASPPPSYYPPVESTGFPGHASINSLQAIPQSRCTLAARPQIDSAYVQKFSLICAPLCQIMSIGVAMYFWSILTLFIYLRSYPAHDAADMSVKFYYIGEVSLFVGGVLALTALCPAFKKKNPCMLTPFIIYQYITGTLIIFGVIANMFFGTMWDIGGAVFIIFFAAFLFFSNYTLCQVIKLRKVMLMDNIRVPNGGGPVYFASSAEGMAVPVYPGATMPLGGAAPKYGNWAPNVRAV